MYYEEKIINGVLMCRQNPKGDWEQCSITKMSRDIIDLKQQLSDLKASLPKVRADAVREATSMVVLAILSDGVEFTKGFESAEMQYSMQLQKISYKLEAGNE